MGVQILTGIRPQTKISEAEIWKVYLLHIFTLAIRQRIYHTLYVRVFGAECCLYKSHLRAQLVSLGLSLSLSFIIYTPKYNLNASHGNYNSLLPTSLLTSRRGRVGIPHSASYFAGGLHPAYPQPQPVPRIFSFCFLLRRHIPCL